jgi:hypothetical protein
MRPQLRQGEIESRSSRKCKSWTDPERILPGKEKMSKCVEAWVSLAQKHLLAVRRRRAEDSSSYRMLQPRLDVIESRFR